MSYKRSALLALSLCATLLAAIVALAFYADGSMAYTGARPVTLSEAERAPSKLRLLAPHVRVTYSDGDGHNCLTSDTGSYFTDTSAYTWRGGALSGQQWNRAHTITYWRDREGRAVTFDGVTFRNHTRHPVLVAAWCDA